MGGFVLTLGWTCTSRCSASPERPLFLPDRRAHAVASNPHAPAATPAAHPAADRWRRGSCPSSSRSLSGRPGKWRPATLASRSSISSAGTTSWIRPMRSASRASNRSPVSAYRRVWRRPIALTMWVEIGVGATPDADFGYPELRVWRRERPRRCSTRCRRRRRSRRHGSARSSVWETRSAAASLGSSRARPHSSRQADMRHLVQPANVGTGLEMLAGAADHQAAHGASAARRGRASISASSIAAL